MKITLKTKDLLTAIAVVSGTVPVRSVNPVLSGILLEADKAEGRVMLSSYNMEAGTQTSVPATVTEDGKVVITAKTIADIARKLPGDDVTLTLKAGKVKIKSGSANFTLATLEAEDFPTLPEVAGQSQTISMPATDFREALKRVLFAVSSDETRPALRGCFFKIKDKKIEIVAIDGFRMALRALETESEDETTALVPGSVLNEAVKILQGIKDDSAQVELLVTDQNSLVIQMPNTKIIGRLIQGEYVNYNGFIPASFSTHVTVSTTVMKDAVERGAILTSLGDSKTPIVLKIAEGNMFINVNCENGTLEESFPVEVVGDEFKISFNPQYLIDALRAIDDDEIIFSFNGEMGPAFITPIDKSDKYKYLLLPLRV